MKLLVCADHRVGEEIVHWLASAFRDDIALVCGMPGSPVLATASRADVPALAYQSPEHLISHAVARGMRFDLGVLAWWPRLIKSPLLRLPAQGFINTHPSLLPYNRGKHYNFWAIVEQAPFGVTLHMVDEGVDSGDIVAQLPVPYGWEDTGATLYEKAQVAMVELFKSAYPRLRTLSFERCPQDRSQGSFHRAAELDEASTIDLDRTYVARDLLNLLRARTFPGHPGCRFYDGDVAYETRITIERTGA